MALSKITIELPEGPVRCTVCRTLQSLPAADAAQLNAWMRDPAISCPTIARATANDEDTPTLTINAVERHIRGECKGQAGERLRP